MSAFSLSQWGVLFSEGESLLENGGRRGTMPTELSLAYAFGLPLNWPSVLRLRTRVAVESTAGLFGLSGFPALGKLFGKLLEQRLVFAQLRDVNVFV